MVDYLHGHHGSVLRSHRSRTAANSAAYLLPHLAPGMRVLDVGSGPGTITCDLADLVAGDGGVVVALETGEGALALTRAEAERRGTANLEYVVGDVLSLGLPEASFDVVHAHQTLQHVTDPVAALQQMARVCRPGGVVAARDSDYSGFRWWPAEPALETWLGLYLRLARATGAEPDAGVHYRAWANAAHLSDVAITSTSWCYADEASTTWWGGLWAERVLQSEFAVRARLAGVTEAELREISDGWQRWSASPDALFTVPSSELLARV